VRPGSVDVSAETRDSPSSEEARSDDPQVLLPPRLRQMMADLKKVTEAVGRTVGA